MNRRVLVVDDSATVRRLVRAILEEAGYEVETAVDGAEGLDRIQRAPFDLALVDFVMPRLNGYQLTQAIRSIPALRALPVVLMSARADQIGARFMSQTGAVATLPKPFPPFTLLDTVGHALDGGGPRRTNGAAPESPHASWLGEHDFQRVAPDPERYPTTERPPPPPPPEAFAPFDAGPPDEGDVSALSPLSPGEEVATRRIVELLGRAVAPALEDLLRRGGPADTEDVVEAIRARVTASQLVALARELRPLELRVRGPVALEGLVALAPLGEIFQLLHLQSQTGLLVIDRDDVQVTVAFREGRVDLALGHGVGSEFRLGRYLVGAELVPRAEVEQAALLAVAQTALLGEVLVRNGRVRPEDLERALSRQTSELVYEILRWSGGRFRFESGAVLSEATAARLGLPIETLVLEGFRRLDEWRVIAEVIPTDAAVLARDEALVAAMAAERLDRQERRVLDAVDGVHTVRDVVRAVEMGSFDACKILYRLVRARLLRVVR